MKLMQAVILLSMFLGMAMMASILGGMDHQAATMEVSKTILNETR